jgi:hypothetical protein
MADLDEYELTYPVEVEMLWQLKKLHMGLMGHCGSYCGADGCSYCRELDLDLLIQRFGPEHVFVNDQWIARRIKCSRCGHKGGTITVKSDTRSQVERGDATGLRRA